MKDRITAGFVGAVLALTGSCPGQEPAGESGTVVAGPGALSLGLSEAMREHPSDYVLVDAGLMAFAVVSELHFLAGMAEMQRAPELRDDLRAIAERAEDGPARRVVRVALSLLAPGEVALTPDEAGERKAVYHGKACALRFADGWVDWGEHGPDGMYRREAPDLRGLWRASRYLHVYAELGGKEMRERLEEAAARAGRTTDHFTHRVLHVGGEYAWHRVTARDCQALALQRPLEDVGTSWDRLTTTLARLGRAEGDSLRNGVLEACRIVLTQEWPEDAWFHLPETIGAARRRDAASYLYVGLREADMAWTPLCRVAAEPPVVLVEPRPRLWRHWKKLFEAMHTSAVELGLEDRRPRSAGELLVDLALRDLRLRGQEPGEEARAALHEEILEHLLTGFMFELEGSPTRIEGIGVMRRTGTCIVSVPVIVEGRKAEALAVRVTTAVRTPEGTWLTPYGEPGEK